MNETLKKIDVTQLLEREDFELLFTSQLELTQEEIDKINQVYYPLYTTFVTNEVPYEEAWVAARNTFISQEPQIGERQKNGK